MECKDCIWRFREIKDGTVCLHDFTNDSFECKESRYPEVKR